MATIVGCPYRYTSSPAANPVSGVEDFSDKKKINANNQKMAELTKSWLLHRVVSIKPCSMFIHNFKCTVQYLLGRLFDLVSDFGLVQVLQQFSDKCLPSRDLKNGWC